ncbi:hypothetical protein TI39_contig378g00011 [Zymoseptoria brevis]|uniref:3'-5' exonuclease domain-containing protein n=1 Tax=Zymoseptoria brevis TaxID=1047168 RepID=A0A0F4GP65_9PEZI|nr:hypothetical protein TI39_contig378g00011 [Zymoseptoria brevis]
MHAATRPPLWTKPVVQSSSQVCFLRLPFSWPVYIPRWLRPSGTLSFPSLPSHSKSDTAIFSRSTRTLSTFRIMNSTGAVGYTLVNTETALVSFLDSLTNLSNNPPALYLDLEGDNLCKDGTLTIISVLVQPLNHVYIIDIQSLGNSAFHKPTRNGSTFKSVLEDPHTTKVFFDVRNDSNALFFLFGISLAGIEDIQLMENASRVDYGRGGTFRAYVAGIGKCIERDAGLTQWEVAKWKGLKSKMASRFDATRFGQGIHVFAARPLDVEALQYCADDVRVLPRLRESYLARLSVAWKGMVEQETAKRVLISQTALYVPKGQQKARGPW